MKIFSAKFANMGFVCVCLVVLMHVHCPWEGGGINRLAVPFFFAMSGYFLGTHVDETGWYVRTLKKRFRTLVVPLFLWCVIWAAFTVPLAVVLNIHAGRDLFANVLTGWGVLRYFALDITRTPALGSLWYVRCLFLFVIISPAIVNLIRRAGILVLIILGGIYYIYSVGRINISFFSYGFSFEGVFYFAVGLYLRMKQVSLSLGPMIGIPVFCAGVLVYYIGHIEVSIAVMIVGLWGTMPMKRLPQVLTKNTFPIYLIHMFVLTLFGSGKVASAPLAVGIGLAAVAMSMIVAEGIRRMAPKFSIVLFGGR